MIFDDGIDDGANQAGIMTAVVPGIVTITLYGTLVKLLNGTTTGDGGKVWTIMYYEVGPAGIEFGVTNGVVNWMVNGGVGN